jgi:hypothetical protein
MPKGPQGQKRPADVIGNALEAEKKSVSEAIKQNQAVMVGLLCMFSGLS